MKKLPTAKEYFNKRYRELGINHADEIEGEDEAIAIEFAKLHVVAALKNAAKNGKAWVASNGEWVSSSVDAHVNKESIINAYPLTNIK